MSRDSGTGTIKRVHWMEQQVAKKRTKRDTQTSYPSLRDPLWEKQWYLHGGAIGGYDMNLLPAWKRGYTGRGVVVTILDDGIEHNHIDLKPNYDPDASWDINGQDPDPMPHYDGSDTNRHGTRCAGEVAAVANNTKCAVGAAFNAKIGGVRMLDGDVSDFVEAQSLSLNPQHIDIYSASWGPDDNGKVVDGPAKLAKEAFIQGIMKGRGGKGSIFVWASGNGGSQYDSCNCDGYTNSLFTLSISSVSERGRKPWYLEECSSTLATTYSSGENYGDRKIITTDLHGECTEAHTGTSASAPLAAAICALALEANPDLTWRDMQYVVMMTARPEPLHDGDWVVNGVGRKVSLKYGYGLMDAAALVELAERWTTVPEQHICHSPVLELNTQINSEGLQVKVDMDGCMHTKDAVLHLEHVQAKVSLRYSRRGDLQLHLISPNGTRSLLLAKRKNDYQEGEFRDWPFMSVQLWGEDPRGTWRLEVENVGSPLNTGTFIRWQLILYGVDTDPIQLRLPLSRPSTPAAQHFTLSNTSPQQYTSKPTPTVAKVSEETSKVIKDDNVSDEGDLTDNKEDVDTSRPLLDSQNELDSNEEEEEEVEEERPGNEDDAVLEEGNAEESEADVESSSSSSGLRPVAGDSKPLAEKDDRQENTENESWVLSKDWTFDRVLCHVECAAELGCRGPDPHNCHTCRHVRLRPGGDCVSSCPPVTYHDTDSGMCQPCSVTCRTCSGPDAADCITCDEGRYLVATNHTCLRHCPKGYLPVGRVCMPCVLPCVACSGTPTTCTACQPDWELQDATCQPACQLYHYRNGDRCEPCVDNCEVCTGPDQEDCVACGHGRLLQNHSCIYACEEGYFATTTNHGSECLRCHSTCFNCKGGGEDECTECMPPFTLHHNQCLLLCDQGEYKSLEATCLPCDPSCLTCNGQSGYDCLSCPANKLLHNGECVASCPPGHFPRSPPGGVAVCAECLPPCATCKDAPKICTSCLLDLALEGGTCTTRCKEREYRGREGCESCHVTCEKCTGPEVDMCTACASSSHLHQGTCVSECPTGHYGMAGNCHECHATCHTCQGGSSTNCTDCAQGWDLVGSTCIPSTSTSTSRMTTTLMSLDVLTSSSSTCQQGYFLNTTIQKCAACDDTCATCNGWGPYHCETCTPPRRLYAKLNSCVLCCSQSVSHSCCSCHPKTGVCMENRNIDYENLPAATSRDQQQQLRTPPSGGRLAAKPSTISQRTGPNGGMLVVVLVLIVGLAIVFVVVFTVLQACSNKQLCWYRHYQPVPMYYHDGSERVITLTKRDMEDEDSVSSA